MEQVAKVFRAARATEYTAVVILTLVVTTAPAMNGTVGHILNLIVFIELHDGMGWWLLDWPWLSVWQSIPRNLGS